MALEQLEDRLAPAQFTWTGLGADRNWGTAANWTGGTPTGALTDDLIFPANPAGTYITNNNLGGLQLNSITFQGGGYVVTGSALTINGNNIGTGPTANAGIVDTGTNQISLNLTLGTKNQTFLTNSGTLILAGPLAEGTASNPNFTLTFAGAGNTLESGIISAPGNSGAAGITMNGTGTLTLAANNTFVGTTAITSGIVNVSTSSGATSGLGGSGGSVTIASGADLQVQGGITIAATTAVTSIAPGATIESYSGTNTLSGNITGSGSGNANINVDQSTLTISGNITNANLGLNVNNNSGLGTLILSPASANTFGGATNVKAGILQITAVNSLQSTSGVNVASGATLQTNGAGISFASVPLTINGAGFVVGTGVPLGALDNLAGSNTWQGAVTLGSSSTITSVAGTLTLSGVVGDSGLAFSLTVGTATLGSGIVALTNADTFSGATTVNSGTLTLSGSGTILNTITVTANLGATVLLDSTGSAVQNRIGTGVSVHLNSSNFTFKGAAAGTTQTLTSLFLDSGYSTVTGDDTNAGTDLLAFTGNLNRGTGATVAFVGIAVNLGTASNQITFAGTGTTLTNNILPFAVVGKGAGAANINDFATYGGSGIADNTNTTASITVGTVTTQNIKITTNTAINITTSTTINSLIIAQNVGSLTITVTAGQTFTIGNGGAGSILIGGATTTTTSITTGTLAFGSNEGIIIAGATTTAALTISAAITGTGSETISGIATPAGTTPTLTETGANVLTGGLNVDAGNITFNNASVLPTTGTIILAGGIMEFGALSPVTSSLALNLNGSVQFLVAPNTFTFSGATSLAGTSVITTSATVGSTITFSGAITGTSPLILAGGTAPLVISGTSNTFSGGLIEQGGAINLAANATLGTGTLTLAGGTFNAVGSPTVYNPVTIANSVSFITTAVTLNGPVSLLSGTITASIGVTINGVVSGTAGLNVAGASTLTLNNANTYSGGTNLTGAGTVIVGNNAAFGTGLVTIGAALVSLQAGVAVTLPNAFSIGAFIVTFGGAVPLAISGVTTLTGNATFTVSNTAGLTFSGPIVDNGAGKTLALNGATGVLYLPAANEYSGGTTITTALTVVAGSNGAFGSGPLSLTAATVLASTPLTGIGNALTLPAGTTRFTGSNPITFLGVPTLTGAVILAVDNSTTFAGNFAASASTLNVNASLGTLTLSGNNSSYTGTVTVNMFNPGGVSGTLAVTNASSLGTGTLTLQNGVLNNTSGGPLTFTNATVNLSGTTPLVFTGSSISFSGAVTLTNSPVIGVDTGVTTTFNGAVTGAGSLTLSNTPVVVASGTTGATLLAPGATLGTLVLTNSGNTYSGGTTINGAIVKVQGAGVLTSSASAVTVNQGGTLTLDNTAQNANRIAASATLTLNGGIVNLLGFTSATTQTITSLVLGAGNSQINLTPGTGVGDTLAITGAISRAANAGTLNITGTNLGGNSGQFSQVTSGSFTGTAAVGGILPYVTINGKDLATAVNTAPGIAAVTSYTTNPSPFSSAGSAANVKLTTAGITTVDQSTTINALVLSSSGTVTLNIPTGVTLTVTSGAVLFTGGGNLSITGGGTLALGTEGFITTDASNGTTSATISASISGSAGLTLSSVVNNSGVGGNLTLSGANTYAGLTGLYGANLTVGHNQALPNSSLAANGLTLISGTIQTSLNSGLFVPNAITMNNSAITLKGSNNLVFTGTVNLQPGATANTNTTLTVSTSGTAVTLFSGVISNTTAANLTKAGSGNLTLSGTNTYTGATFISAGIVTAQNVQWSGAAAATNNVVVANNAAIQILNSAALATLNALGKAYLYGNGPDGTGALRLMGGTPTGTIWTGNIVLPAPASIGTDGGTNLAFTTGTISGPGDLTKLGLGFINVAGANTSWFGNTILSQGLIQLVSNSGLGAVTGTVTVQTGATLQFNAALTVVGKSLFLNGSGAGSGSTIRGTLQSAGAFNTLWNGNVTMVGGAGISVANAGQTLTINGVVSGSVGLTKYQAGTLILADSNTFSGNINVAAGILTLSNLNSYAGTTTVSGSPIGGAFVAGQLNLNGLGSALNSTAFAINQGGTLLLDNSAFNSPGRISASISSVNVPITMNSGKLTFQALNVAGIASSQSLGSIMLQSGQSTINAGYATTPVAAGATSVVTSSALVRNAGSMVNFIGGTVSAAGVEASPLGTATNKLLFGSSGGSFNDGGLTSVNGTAGTFTGNRFQYFGTGSGGAADVVNILPFAEVNGATATTTAVTGGIGNLTTYAANGIAAFIDYVTQPFSGAGTLNAFLPTDIVHITATGAAAYAINALANQSVGALFITNNITVSPLTLTSVTNFTINSGAIMSNGTGAVAVATIFGGTAWTLPSGGDTCLFANINIATGTSNTNFAVPVLGTATSSLVIGGFGSFQFSATALTGSTYAGGTWINSSTHGYLSTNSGSLGASTAPVTLTGGELTSNFAGALQISNPINLNGFVSFNNNGNNNTESLTFSGPVTLTKDSFVTVTNNNNVLTIDTVTFSSSIGESGGSHSLTAAVVNVNTGTSTLALNNANTFSGGLNIQTGTGNVTLGNAAAAGTGTLMISGGIIVGNNLALNNPVIINNNFSALTSNLTLNGTVLLDTFGPPVATITGITLTFDGVVSGGGITFNSTGTATFNNVNTFSGGVNWITTSGGTLIAGNNAAFGTGILGLNILTTTIQASVPVTIANPLFAGGTTTFGGTAPMTFTGQIFRATATTYTINNTGGVNFAGPMSDVAGIQLTLAGTGTVFLNANALTDGFIVAANTLTVIAGSNGAFGTGALTLTAGTIVASQPVTITNAITRFAGTITLGGAAMLFTGTYTFSAAAGANSLTVNNSTTFNGAWTGGITGNTGTLGGTGTLTLNAAGNITATTTLTVSMASNGYFGTLVLGVSNPFSATAASVPLTWTAGNLSSTGNFTLANNLTFSASTMGLVNSAANPLTLSGTVTMAGAATLLVDGTGSTTFNSTAVFSGAGALTVASLLPAPVAGSVVIQSASNGYTANVTVNGGTLSISGAAGTLGSTAYTVGVGGTLLLDNSVTNLSLRLAAAAALTLNGGTFAITGNNSAATTESIGALTVGAGAATILTKSGVFNLSLTFASMSRSSGGTINFSDSGAVNPLGSPFNQVVLAAAPTGASARVPDTDPNGVNNGGILPYATVDGAEYATFNGASGASNVGIKSYTTAGGGYDVSVNLAGAGDNVKNTAANASDPLGATTTVNSLTYSGGGSASLNLNGGTLTVTSGALLIANNTNLTISNGTLVLGAEGFINAAAGSSVLFSGAINASGNNLTVTGGGTVTLPTANNFGSGTTALDGGATLNLGAATAIGSGTLILSSGTLQSSLASSGTLATGLSGGLTLANALTLANSNVTLGGNGNALTFTNAAPALSGTTVILNTLTASDISLFTGALTGAVNLTKNGFGALGLSGANANLAQVTIDAGIVNAQNNTALGAATNSAVVTSSVTSVSITNSGTGYILAPTVTFSGGGGSGATGSAVLGTGGQAGQVVGVTITNGGSGYTSAPTVTFSGVGFTTAASGLTANLTGATLQIQSGLSGLTKPLVFTGGAGAAGASGALQNVSGTNTIAATGTLLLQATTTIGVDAGALTLSGIISGPGGLTATIAGTSLTMNAANTYLGTTTINQGTVIGTNIAAGAMFGIVGSTVVLGDGVHSTLVSYTGNTATLAHPVTITAGSPTEVDVTTSGQTLTIGGNIAANASTLTIGGAGNTLISTVISGVANLISNSTGTLTLTGANTYTGTTAINSGTVSVNTLNASGGSSSLGNASSVVALGSGSSSALTYTGNSATYTRGFTLGAAGGELDYNPIAASQLLTVSTGTIDNTSGGLFSINVTAGTGNITINSVIGAGSGGLTKGSTSTLTLNGPNTYTGKTSIQNGTVSIATIASVNGGASNLGAPTTVANGTIDLGSLTNAVTLIYTGAGNTTDRVLNLAGTTGAIALEADGSGAIVFSSNLTVTGAGIKTLTLQGASAAANTIQGNIINGSSATALTKAGSGTWILSGANSYTGATTVSAGTLKSGVTNALTSTTALTINGTGTLDLAGFNQTVGSLSGGGVSTGTLTSSSGTPTFTDNDSVGNTFAGTISGSLSLVMNGTNTLTLSGANTYTGSTSINQGTISVTSLNSVSGGSASSSLGAPTTVANGTINLGNAATTGTLIYTGTGQTTDRVINLAGTTGGGTIDSSGTGALVFSSSLTATGAGSKTLTLQGSNTAANTIQGTIVDNSGANKTSLTKAGVGTWVLGSANTYTGATTVSGSGTLKDGTPNALPTTTALTISGTATFDMNGFAQTVGSLSGISGTTLTSSSGTPTFTDNDSGTNTFAGNITGSLGFTMSGAGTLTLTNANNYTGATIISSGTIKDGATNALPSGTTLTISGSGTLDINGNAQTVASLISASALATLTSSSGTPTFTDNEAGTQTFAGLITGSLNFTKGGVGTLTLTKANTYSGATIVNAGTLKDGIANALPIGTPLTVGGASGSPILDLSGFSQQVASLYDGGFSNGTVTNSSATAVTFTDTASSSLSFAGVISGILSLIFNGTSILTLTGANTYTGKTSIQQGTISVSSLNSVTTPAPTASSNLGTPTTVANGTIDLGSGTTSGTLIYTGSGQTTDRVINLAGTTGGGVLEADGSGAVVFSSNLTVTGVGAKTLTLQGTSAANNTFQGVIPDSSSGATSFVKAETGVWVLTGNNTYTGATTISNGTLSASNIVVSGGASNLGNATTPVLLGPGDATHTGALSYTSSGITYTRGFKIVPGNGLGGEFDVTSSGQTVILPTSIALPISLTIGGAGNTIVNGLLGPGSGGLTKTGAGTLTLNAADSYTGATTVSGGSIVFGAAGAIPNSTNLTISGGTLDLAGNNLTVGFLSDGGSTAGTITNSAVGAVTLTDNDWQVHTYGGLLTQSGGNLAFTLNATGIVTLTNNSNAYAGGTNINAGTLSVSTSGALGNVANSTTVASGATLQLSGTTAFASRPLTIAGVGAVDPATGLNRGALQNFSGTNSWAGAITLAGNTSLGAAAGSTLTITSTGVISDGTSTFSLTKLGAGTVALQAVNTYKGATTVALNGGTLTLSGAGAIATSASPLTVNQNGTLAIDDSLSAPVANRIGTGVALHLNGGSFTFNGNAAGSTQTLSTLFLDSGNSTVSSTTNGVVGNTLTFSGTLTRAAGATVTFLGVGTSLGSATNQITFTGTAPTLNTGNILPYALVGNLGAAVQDFASYSTGGNTGIAALAAGSYVTTNTAGTSATVYKLTNAGPATLVPTTANAIIFITSATATAWTLPATLTVGDGIQPGAVVVVGSGSGATTLQTGTLAFGTSEGIIAADATGTTTTITSPITASNGVTYASTQALTVSTGANVIAGGVTIAAGAGAGTQTLSASAIIPTSGSITLASGTISASASVSTPIPLNLNGNVTLAATGAFTYTFSGTTNVTGASTLTTNVATTLSGAVTGSGNLVYAGGSSTLSFAGGSVNNWTGGVVLQSSTLTLSTGGGVGSGTLVLAGGTLNPGTAAIYSPVVLANSFTLSTNSLTLNGPVTTLFQTAAAAATVNTTLTLTINGVVSGSADLNVTAAGTGSLTLNAANTYSGGTLLNVAGTITVGNNAAFGASSGAVTINTAPTALTPSVSVSLANPFTLGANLTVSGTTPLAFTGRTTLNAAIFTLTNNNTGGTTFGGVIDESGNSRSLTVAGTGTLFLSAANVYTGGTTLNSATAIVVAGNNAAFGSGTLTLTNGTLLASTALTGVANAVALSTVIITGSNPITFSGGAALSAAATSLTVNNATTFSGVISGAGTNNLTLAGTGTVSFAAANTYTGITTLNMAGSGAGYAGTLILGTNTSLGMNATAASLTVMAGNIQASATVAVANPVTFNAGSTLGITGGNNLTLSGAVILTGTNILSVSNTGATTFAGVIDGGASSLTLAGTSTVSLTNANTYTGSTTVSGGTLILSSNGATDGSLASTGAGAIVLNNGGTLQLDNSVNGNKNNRLAAAAQMILNGGTLTIVGNAAAPTSESIASITANSGNSSINLTKGAGGTLTLNVTGVGGLTRVAGSGATLNFNDGATGANLTANSVIVNFTTPPTLTGTAQPGGTGMLPFATVTTSAGLEFATYAVPAGKTTASIVPYSNVGAAYATSVSVAGTGKNVRNSTNNTTDTITVSKTINSLAFAGGGTATLNLNNNAVLTITSGALLTTNNTTLTIQGNGTLLLGTEGIIITDTGASVTINAVINSFNPAGSSNNLTISGGGTLILNAANNMGTGLTALNGGTLILNNNAAAGIGNAAIGTGALTLTNGTLQTGQTSGVTLASPVILNNATITLGGSPGGSMDNALLFTGAVTFSGTSNTVNTPGTDFVYFNGTYNAGAGNLIKTGSDTLYLAGGSGTNYTGQVFVNTGIVTLQSVNALGANNAATVVASGAAIQVLFPALTFTHPLVLNGDGPTGGGALEFLGTTGASLLQGGLIINSNSTIGLDGATSLTQTVAPITGTGNLTKIGAGNLVLNLANPNFTGQVNINGGNFDAQIANALGMIANGVVVNQSAVQTINFFSNTAGTAFADAVAGGTFTMTYNGQSTGAITFDPIFSNLQSNILASLVTPLAAVYPSLNITSGNIGNFVAIKNGRLDGTTAANVYITLQGALASQTLYPLVFSATGLTGGTAPNFSITQNPATLRIEASIVGKQLTLNGAGFGNANSANGEGTLFSLTNNTTWSGNISLAKGAVIANNTAATTLTITGTISNDGTGLTMLGLAANANFVLANSNTFTGNLTILGGGTTLANANVYAGSTTISGSSTATFNAGSLTLSGLGTALSSTSFTVNPTSSLILDNFNAGNGIVFTTTRISTVPITLGGGTLTFRAINVTGMVTNTSLGPVSADRGQNTINIGFGGATGVGATSVVTLTSTGLTRNTGATVNFLAGSGNALGTASNQLIIPNLVTTNTGPVGFINNNLQYVGNSASGTTFDNIVPWAEVGGGAGTGDFATYTTNGIAAFSNYIAGVGTNAGDIVKITGNGAAQITPNVSLGAVLFTNGTAASVLNFGTATPSVASGAILLTGATAANIATTGALNLSTTTNEAFLFQNNSGNITVTPANGLTGTGALVFGGTNVITLTTANNYSGGTYLNAGQINTSATAQIFGAGTVTLTGGTLGNAASPAATVTYSNNVVLNGYIKTAYSITGSAITFTGSTTLTNNAVVNPIGNTTSDNFTLGGIGAASNAYSLTYIGQTAAPQGFFGLGSSTNWTGTFTMTSGQLLTTVANFNASTPLFLAGTLNGGTTTAPVTLIGNVGLLTGGLNLNGAVSLVLNNVQIASSVAAALTVNGVISGTGGLQVSGGLTGSSETLAAANTYQGGTIFLGTTINTLNINNNNALGTGPFSVNNPASAPNTIASGLAGGVTVANPLIFNDTVGVQTIGGAQPINFTGLTTLAAATQLTASDMGSSRVDLQACKLEYSIVSPK